MAVHMFQNSLASHAQALALREERAAVLASNIANAATPGFKARDINFDATYAAALGTGNIETTHPDHISTSIATGSGNLHYRVPVSASLDGNTVDLSVEQMEFSENTLRYQASLQLLNGRMSGLMSAIRGE